MTDPPLYVLLDTHVNARLQVILGIFDNPVLAIQASDITPGGFVECEGQYGTYWYDVERYRFLVLPYELNQMRRWAHIEHRDVVMARRRQRLAEIAAEVPSSPVVVVVKHAYAEPKWECERCHDKKMVMRKRGLRLRREKCPACQ